MTDKIKAIKELIDFQTVKKRIEEILDPPPRSDNINSSAENMQMNFISFCKNICCKT